GTWAPPGWRGLAGLGRFAWTGLVDSSGAPASRRAPGVAPEQQARTSCTLAWLPPQQPHWISGTPAASRGGVTGTARRRVGVLPRRLDPPLARRLAPRASGTGMVARSAFGTVVVGGRCCGCQELADRRCGCRKRPRQPSPRGGCGAARSLERVHGVTPRVARRPRDLTEEP